MRHRQEEPMDLGLGRKVVFITGASGGIGWATAEAFAEEGARLALHGHRSFQALRTRAEERWNAEQAFAYACDLSEPEGIARAMEAAAAQFGRIDVCIANAGIWHAESVRLDQMPTERFRETIAVNLLGAAWTARAFLRVLTDRGPRPGEHGASLLFIGSTAGRFGERGHSDYSATKAGLYGLVRTLKNEIVQIDPRGRVNMIEPGWTVTEMARPALQDPEALPRAVRTMPLQQVGTAKDIARAAVFLSSPTAAQHISGEVLTIAGGMEGRVQWELQEIDGTAVRRRSGLE
ncbi:MAG: SDR family oxidoreductase [Candidatus Eisenbacteria bacterium]|nr:SDR family oxidoreductase [Candidatus Eisenbacteria bacterium]